MEVEGELRFEGPTGGFTVSGKPSGVRIRFAGVRDAWSAWRSFASHLPGRGLRCLGGFVPVAVEISGRTLLRVEPGPKGAVTRWTVREFFRGGGASR